MPAFLQGRRAFLSSLRRRHRRCNPLSVHRVTNSGLAYPRRAYSCRACPAAAACHSYPSSSTPLPPSVAPTLPRLPRCRHLSLLPSLCLLRCRRLRIPRHRTDRPLSRSVRTAARSAPLLPSCPRLRHGPRPFCCSARGPRPGARGTKKGGRNRTEARPPPKSNQSVAAASPRQVIWLSGKSPFLKVGIRTPGNTRSSPAPKRTVFRYRAALRKVHHQANKATSRRSRTDN